MADKRKLYPISLPQNPTPVNSKSQEYERALEELIENILIVFKDELPSNYVSETMGPNYMKTFYAFSEQLAKIQLSVQEIGEDYDYDFTRPEYLWQFLTSIVFPLGETRGIPSIDGDLRYRDFLKKMVGFLLEGAKPGPIKSALSLLTSANIEVIEKVLFSGKEWSYWDIKDQFTFEINVSTDEGDSFPTDVDPFVLQNNIKLVLEALKPAHSLYELRFLFKDFIGMQFEDVVTIDSQLYYYEDFRKNCNGVLNLVGTEGKTYNYFFFTDPNRSFSSISSRSLLHIESGINTGINEIEDVLFFIEPTDTQSRKYITSPTGLTGYVTIQDGNVLVDSSANFGLCVENEIIEILEGPNIGRYRMDLLLDGDSGLVGLHIGPSTRVRISPSILKLSKRVLNQSNIPYRITVDRLGIKTPISVIRENVSPFFFL
jgi:hypothetical protein